MTSPITKLREAPKMLWTNGRHNGSVGECWYDAVDEPRPARDVQYVRADLVPDDILKALEAQEARDD